MGVWPNEIVQLIQNSIDNFDKKVTLLRISCSQEQRKNMIKKGSSAELPSVDCNLPQSCLSHLRVSVLNL